MQLRHRSLLLAVGAIAVVWVAAVILQLLQLSSPQPLVLVLLGVTGVAVPLLMTLVVVAAVDGQRRRANAVATRIANLEQRLEQQRAAADALGRLEAAVHELGGRVRAVELAAGSLDDLDARSQAAARSVEHLEAQLGEAEKRLRDVDIVAGRTIRLERRLRELDRGIGKAARDPAQVRMQEAHELVESILAVGHHRGMEITEILTQRQAAEQVRWLVAHDRSIEALPYLRAFPGVVDELSLGESRALLKFCRRVGYWDHALSLLEAIVARFGDPEDRDAADRHRSELALYRGELGGGLGDSLPPLEGDAQPEVVVHVVGRALPETQSGYTLRTQYTVEAQRRLGLTPVVVVQAGVSERAREVTESYTQGDVSYHLLGGPQRGRVPWDEWLEANVIALAEVVRAVRPAVLHVHSDFLNALIALPVARAYGIPVVNETRGFWEESWLSRTATAEGWSDVAAVAEQYGYPELYTLRAEREAVARSASDAVVTLARVMRDHIEQVAHRLGRSVPDTSLAPNAVEVADFPVSSADPSLRRDLGIDPGTVVVGYISSIVEYEGIDTLVRAMFELELVLGALRAQPATPGGSVVAEDAAAALAQRMRMVHPDLDDEVLLKHVQELMEVAHALRDVPVQLLVVGDGAELENLRSLSAELALRSVLFTGRVAHERVADFYGLIDLFVVPRKRAAVTELVTPLKPFEALSTGRPCVFSDVAALAEIATDSGCVELFRAGDHHDLALTIGRLVADPERLAEMSRDGAEWVRNARTWDLNARVYLDVYRSLGLAPLPDGDQNLRDQGPASNTA